MFLDDCITYSNNNHHDKPFIEYEEFMAQQKENNEMKTYYVTQEQLDLIEELRSRTYSLDSLILSSDGYFKPLVANIMLDVSKALLRYLGGDETIEFKVKEQLYRLRRIDDCGNCVYMKLNALGTPDWSINEKSAFTAPLEEIKKWKIPSWDIEEVK